MAAKIRGIDAHIVMPSNSPMVKRNAVQYTYKAHLHLCEPVLAARESTCIKIQNETGANMVHPYNDYRVINGQATVFLELYSQMQGNLDAIIVPVSGGGLISGVAMAAHWLSQGKIKVYAAERANARDAYDSKKAKQLQGHKSKPNTIADGLLAELVSLYSNIHTVRVL